MSLHINMFEYKNKPFGNGLTAYVFCPKQKLRARGFTERQIGMLLGIASRSLEGQIGKNSAVSQYSDDIYCAPFNPALLPKEIPVESRLGSFVWTIMPDQKRLVPSYEEDREIIRRLVARAIAGKQIENGWFVDPYGFAYHWSFNLSKQLYTGIMDVYPGFVFRPNVYEDGSCAIMVDPRFKFVPKKNLRDIIEDLSRKGVDKNQIKLRFEGDFVIDACPVVECPHRKNPSSNCRLSGAGKRRRLVQLDFERRPSQATIGSLIEYHKDQSICPLHGRIAEMIIDLPPIALIEIAARKDLLEYPVERLRQELKLERLNKQQRLLVMKYIQPSMNTRWNLTENFLTYVDDILIGRMLRLRLIRRFAKAGSPGKYWEKYSIFEEIPLAFGNQTSSYDPFLGLERNGPYDSKGKDEREFRSLRLIMCNLSPKLTLKSIRRFYNDLVEGFSGRARFAGMKKIFRLRIPRFSEDLLFPDLNTIEKHALQERPDVVIVFARKVGRNKIRQYEQFKRRLTERGIASQFILEDKFGPMITPGRYVSHLKNLALSIYCKAGGVPWVLSRPVSRNSCYVGLAMIIRRGITHMSTQVFDSVGMWLGGWTEFVSNNKYAKKLVDRIGDAQEIYAKEKGRSASKVVLHKEGEMRAEIETQTLIDAFQSGLICASVKRTPLPRLYDPTTRIDYMVPRGSYVQISNTSALLAASGPPHPIRGSQRPIVIELKNRLRDSLQLKNICEEIFSLSLVSAYSLAVISKPITTRFAKRALSLASKYKIVESPKLWRKAWFL